MTEQQVNDAMGEVLEEQRTEMKEKFGEPPEITEGYRQTASGLYVPTDADIPPDGWDPDVPRDEKGFQQWVCDEVDKLFGYPFGKPDVEDDDAT